MSDEQELRIAMVRLHRFFARQGLAANDEARDAVQETLLRGCRTPPKGDAEPIRWLYGIARRVMLEQRRKRGREVPCESIEEHGADSGSEGAVDARSALAAIPGMSRSDQVALLAEDCPELLAEEELEEFRSLGDVARRSRVCRARGRLRRAA